MSCARRREAGMHARRQRSTANISRLVSRPSTVLCVVFNLDCGGCGGLVLRPIIHSRLYTDTTPTSPPLCRSCPDSGPFVPQTQPDRANVSRMTSRSSPVQATTHLSDTLPHRCAVEGGAFCITDSPMLSRVQKVLHVPTSLHRTRVVT